MTQREKISLLESCRGALASRGRETDTVTHTDTSRVKLFQMKQGVDVALFELVPEKRLAIESYIGFVAARGRVPVAYGGAWILGYRAEIGVNIFEEFRGGDSRGLFSAVMQTYQDVFGIKTWLVHPTQFGDDNKEAIASGAFWFYYKLGFRPDHKALRALASREQKKRARNIKYRSSKKILKRLSKKQLILSVGSKAEATDKRLVTQEIGLRLLKVIGDDFKGDKILARHEAKKIWHKLGASKKSPFPEIALLLLLLKDVTKWSHNEQRSLRKIFSLKQGRSERNYVLAFQQHERLRATLRCSIKTVR